MARDLLAASVPVEECQQVLGEWLQQYSLSVEECERLMHEEDDLWYADICFSRPIADVVLELRPGQRSSGHEVTVTLNPFLQLEGWTTFRLVLPVPRLGPGR
jgi:hypothetical protein